jgi:hypothetical protein
MSEAITAMNSYFGTDFIGGRLHTEQTTLHGDPAVKMNSFPKADFVVEQTQIQIVPNIVSVADNNFSVKATLYNVGKATGDSVMVQVKQTYPNGTESFLFNKRIKAIRYSDSVVIQVPIVALRDKGEKQDNCKYRY